MAKPALVYEFGQERTRMNLFILISLVSRAELHPIGVLFRHQAASETCLDFLDFETPKEDKIDHKQSNLGYRLILSRHSFGYYYHLKHINVAFRFTFTGRDYLVTYHSIWEETQVQRLSTIIVLSYENTSASEGHHSNSIRREQVERTSKSNDAMGQSRE